MAPTLSLGIVCPLVDEARTFGLDDPTPEQTQEVAPGIHVFLSGIGPRRAAQGACALIRQGCQTLLSFGYCGGIDPRFEAGDLVLTQRVVVAESEAHVHPPLRESPAYLLNLREALMRAHLPLITHDDTVVVSSAEPFDVAMKRCWAARWSHAVVDMESAAIMEMAHRHGRDVFVLRAVLDRQGQELPRGLSQTVDPWGRLHGPWYQRAKLFVTGPATRLVSLSLARHRALASLRRAAQILMSNRSLFAS